MDNGAVSDSGMSRDIYDFALALVGRVREDSDREFKRLGVDDFQPHSQDDVVLSEEVVRRISPIVHRWRLDLDLTPRIRIGVQQVHDVYELSTAVCPHKPGCEEVCRCPIPSSERRMSAFLRRYRIGCWNDFLEENNDSLYNAEVVKTLILYGEMDALLRIVAVDDSISGVDLVRWYDIATAMCYCGSPDENLMYMGWNLVISAALEAYICLNLSAASRRRIKG